MTPDELFEVAFDHSEPLQERLDLIFEALNHWLLEGKEEKVNQIFFALKEGYMEECTDELAIGVGFLAVTSGTNLRDRKGFCQSFEQEIEKRYDNVDSELLIGGVK